MKPAARIRSSIRTLTGALTGTLRTPFFLALGDRSSSDAGRAMDTGRHGSCSNPAGTGGEWLIQVAVCLGICLRRG